MKRSSEDRKTIILDLLKEAGKLSVDSLAEELNVSPMTVNRDIRELAGEGKIRRLHGLILSADEPSPSGECAMCRREVSERTQFLVLFQPGKLATYCCPHCGFSQFQSASSPSAVFATDFLFGTMINAYSATYLIGSRINLCCQPTVLGFSRPEDAAAFQKGFGGKIYSLNDAVHFLYQPGPNPTQ
jgi:DeoR family transcriptional regulator, copper-sensing transcriptional repressor